MSTEGEPTVVLPGGVLLSRVGRTPCHNGLEAARVAVNKNKTAAPLDLKGGLSCYVSFTLAAPGKGISCLNLHWPKEQGSDIRPAYSYVRATDKELVLFEVFVPPNQICYWATTPDLFVYTAGSLPSVQRLPPYTSTRERPFLMDKLTTGILRLAEDRYIVADLNVYAKEKEAGMRVELCMFDSILGKWEITPNMSAPEPQDQSNGGLFPNLWSTDNVLAFAGCFLCWIDYFSGVLLCNFSNSSQKQLRFVPFPGEKEYHDAVRVERCFPERFRSVSISQDKMCFVHIDNDFHDRLHNGWQQPPQNPQITIWTLNSKFKWELHHVINLHSLWLQPAYQLLGIHQRLPEFPVISTEDPNVLCSMLTEKEFGGKGWMIIVDNQSCLRSCTEFVDAEGYDDEFPTIPLLPTVFCNYLERPTGTWDNNKVPTRLSKKHKVATRLSKKHKAANLRSKNRKLCEV